MMFKLKTALPATAIVIIAALTAALLLVFGFGAPVSASADDGAVSGVATVKVGENAAVEYGSIEEAFDAANAETSPVTVKMLADATTTDTLTVLSGRNITLDLNDRTLEYDNDNAHNPVITVLGTFTLKDGSLAQNGVITGGTGRSEDHIRGGGVMVDGGAFTMLSGTISGNAAEQGGGVNVNNRSTFTITGGTISGNEALDGSAIGGGVCIAGSSNFTMKGGTISGNTAANGGGVHVAYTGVLELSGGEISCNTATAVYSDDDGEYYGGNGGGVYIYYGGKFTMSGGMFGGNTATAVYSDDDGKCYGGNGGGVYVGGGTFDMSGGMIGSDTEDDKNAALNGGGGVCVYGGTFTMSGGEISGNDAEGYGGGVFVYGGTLNMSGAAVISGNTANVGGGVCVISRYDDDGDVINSFFNMMGGTIGGDAENDKNTAENGGGVYINICTLEMSGGKICNNEAQYNGGGVCVENDGTLDMSGTAVISENYAEGDGGGVYVSYGILKLSGTPNITNNLDKDSADNNVFLGDDDTITVTDALSDGAKICVNNIGDIATGYTQADKPSKFFIPDDETNDCIYVSDKTTGVVTVGVHDYADKPMVDKEPNCMKAGSQSIHCKNCDSRKDEEVIAALGHDFSEEYSVDKEPTCTEEGSKSRHCKRCDEKTDVTAIPTVPHTLTRVPEIPATEDKNGNKEYWTCDDCDKYFADEDGKKEITDKSSVVIPKLKNDDNSVLWVILIAILCAVIAVEVGVIIYRAKLKAKAKENE